MSDTKRIIIALVVMVVFGLAGALLSNRSAQPSVAIPTTVPGVFEAQEFICGGQFPCVDLPTDEPAPTPTPETLVP